MPRPTTTVEIAFNVGYTGTPVWTDVTSRVRVEPGISIEHWRGDEESETSPSRCSFVLRNDDGRFTPGNTDGFHYPNVKRNRPIRVRSTHNGVGYSRFYGYIDDWVVEWPATVGAISDCAVSATSRMSRLGRGTELRPIISEEMAPDAPDAYYTMGEPEGSTQANDTSTNLADPLTLAGSGSAVTFGSGTGVGTDGLTAAMFAGGKYLTRATDGGATFSAFVNSTGNGNFFDIEGTTFGANVGSANLSISGTTLSGVAFATNGNTASVTASLSAGETHHVAFTLGGTIRLYVDGVEVDNDLLSGVVGARRVNLGSGGWQGTMSHFAIFNTALAADRIAVHSEAGLTGFAGETSADRIERLARYANVSDFDTAVVGSTPIAHFDITGMTALDAMRKVEVAEGGILFDQQDGTLCFRGRDDRYGAATAFTVNVAAGHVATTPRPVLDDQLQVNDLTVTNADGVPGRQFDQASIDENGLYRDSIELASNDAEEPLMRAGWMVSRYAEQPERISSVEILLNTAPNVLVQGVFQSTPATKFTLTGLPSNAPASSMSLFVEGRSEQITMNEDRVTFHTSPADLYDVWTVGDATLGAWDETPIAY